MDALNTHNCLGLIQVSISFSQLIKNTNNKWKPGILKETSYSHLWLFLHFILKVLLSTQMMDALNTHNCLGLIQISISFSQLISRLA